MGDLPDGDCNSTTFSVLVAHQQGVVDGSDAGTPDPLLGDLDLVAHGSEGVVADGEREQEGVARLHGQILTLWPLGDL